MAKFIGRKVEAAIGIESSRGVGVTPAYALGKVDFSLFDKSIDARNDESLGNIADSENKFVVEKYAQGALGGPLGANSALYLLGLALGTLPTVGSVSDSRYPWTLAVANNNQNISASILVKDGNESRLHKLVMLDTFEIMVDLEDLVRYNAEFISKVARGTTQSIPSYVNDYKFTKRKAKVFLADNIGGLDAASRVTMKSFKLVIKKNLVRDSSIGTVEPQDILNQSLSIEGEIKLNYTDQTYRSYMLNGTKKALRLQLESEDLVGATAYPDLKIDLPKVDFFSWEPDAPNDEIVMNTINFKANLDLTNGIVSTATVRNALGTI